MLAQIISPCCFVDLSLLVLVFYQANAAERGAGTGKPVAEGKGKPVDKPDASSKETAPESDGTLH